MVAVTPKAPRPAQVTATATYRPRTVNTRAPQIVLRARPVPYPQLQTLPHYHNHNISYQYNNNDAVSFLNHQLQQHCPQHHQQWHCGLLSLTVARWVYVGLQCLCHSMVRYWIWTFSS
jgi:hypothetical protein